MAVLASRREIVSAYRWIELRAYCVPEGSGLIGKSVKDVLPGERLLIERMRRDGQIIEADPTTVLRAGDIAAISGRRELLVQQVDGCLPEVRGRETHSSIFQPSAWMCSGSGPMKLILYSRQIRANSAFSERKP